MPALHLVTRFNVGGIARYLEHAHAAVEVLVRGRVEGNEREAPWAGEEIRLPSLGRSLRPVQDGRAFADLVALLRRRRPHAIHTHASKAGALGRAAAALLGIPSVHTFHGHVLRGYFSSAASLAMVAVERLLARRGLLTATGPATAAELHRLLGVPVEILPPGIALPFAAADSRDRWRRAWGEPARVALAVGRAAPVKDLPRFVRAARAAGYLPVVAGADAVPGALALGHVARIEEIYAAADVVVCSSVREGTPFALLEASWCGVPVVAPPIGDVEWVLGGAGVVTHDLEEGLRRLRDVGLREELGGRAAKQVRERFPAAAVAPRLLELYARLPRG